MSETIPVNYQSDTVSVGDVSASYNEPEDNFRYTVPISWSGSYPTDKEIRLITDGDVVASSNLAFWSGEGAIQADQVRGASTVELKVDPDLTVGLTDAVRSLIPNTEPASISVTEFGTEIYGTIDRGFGGPTTLDPGQITPGEEAGIDVVAQNSGDVAGSATFDVVFAGRVVGQASFNLGGESSGRSLVTFTAPTALSNTTVEWSVGSVSGTAQNTDPGTGGGGSGGGGGGGSGGGGGGTGGDESVLDLGDLILTPFPGGVEVSVPVRNNIQSGTGETLAAGLEFSIDGGESLDTVPIDLSPGQNTTVSREIRELDAGEVRICATLR